MFDGSDFWIGLQVQGKFATVADSLQHSCLPPFLCSQSHTCPSLYYRHLHLQVLPSSLMTQKTRINSWTVRSGTISTLNCNPINSIVVFKMVLLLDLNQDPLWSHISTDCINWGPLFSISVQMDIRLFCRNSLNRFILSKMNSTLPPQYPIDSSN